MKKSWELESGVCLQFLALHEIVANLDYAQSSKSDKVDARKLADLLRSGMLRPVYHGENGLRTLRELARSYQIITEQVPALQFVSLVRNPINIG
jgi:hypothetical protein